MTNNRNDQKYWKIGTNIFSYLRRFEDMLKANKEILNCEKISFISTDKSLSAIFKKENMEDVTLTLCDGSEATQNQFLAILITFGYFKFKNTNQKLIDMNELVEQEYYLTNKINMFDNFISKHKDIIYIEKWVKSVDEAEEKKFSEYNIPEHKNQKKALFSFLFALDLQLEESDISRRDFSKYWKIPDDLWPNKLQIQSLKKIILVFLQNGNEYSKIKINKSDEIASENIKLTEYDQKNNEIYSEVINLYKFLIDNKFTSKFKIPIMQRKYVWTEDLINKFLISVFDLIDKKNKYIYISSIVYKEDSSSNGMIKILDGQQRLTTLSLMLTALVILSKKEFDDIKLPYFIIDLFDNSTNTTLMSKKFVRVSGSSDYEALINILGLKITKDLFVAERNKTNIVVGFETIRDSIRELIKKHLENNETNDAQNVFNELFTIILNRILFTATKDNHNNEYKLFQTLNTSSITLTHLDLLKNLLLSYIDNNDLDENEQVIEKYFNENISDIFSKKGIADNKLISNFFEYFININDATKENGEPIDIIRKILEKNFNFTENLKFEEFKFKAKKLIEEINIYFDISDSERFTNKQSRVYIYSDLLTSFKGRNVYIPIIKYIIFDFNEQVFEYSEKTKKVINDKRKILFELERFEVIHQLTSYRGQSLTQSILKLTKNVKEIGDDLCPKKMRHELNELGIISSIEPTQKMTEFTSSSPIPQKMLPIITQRIENWAKNNKTLELNTEPDFAYNLNRSIEHIIPQSLVSVNKPKSWLKQIDIETIEKNKERINMIGNILLIEQKLNAKLKNDSFKKKKVIYNKDNKLHTLYLYTKIDNLKEVDKFDFSNVAKRSKKISKILETIYS